MKTTLAVFVLAALVLAPQAYAQKVKGNGNLVNKTRQVGSFSQIGVGGSFDVELIKGSEGKIEISVESNLEPYLITEVDGDKLKIKWKKNTNIRTTKTTKVKVYFKALNGVALAGAGDISSKDVLEAETMKIAIAGSGDIVLPIKATEAKAAISGSGDIELSGSADQFRGAIAGSGDIKAFGLQVEKSEVKISGSGDVEINVQSELVARISGSGDIVYKGQPRIEDIKVSGSGSVSSH